MDYYPLEILGLKRNLPIIKIGRNSRIASFTILGDVELTDKLADEIAKHLKKIKFDYIVGPEVKAVPLVHGVAKRLGHKRFVICRKSIKPYMVSPIKVAPLSHFPKHVKPLVLNGSDADILRGKKVVIVDDVISTGVTIRMMKHLLKKVDADVIKTVAAAKQGEQFDTQDDLYNIAEIPILKD